MSVHIYEIDVNQLFHQFTKCLKLMFLGISDSVMNTHM